MPSHKYANRSNAAPHAPRAAHSKSGLNRRSHRPQNSGRVVAWLKNPLVAPGRDPFGAQGVLTSGGGAEDLRYPKTEVETLRRRHGAPLRSPSFYSGPSSYWSLSSER